jgi:chromosome segregation ATPase
VELVKFKELEERIKGLVEEYNVLKKRTKELEELIEIKSGELKEANSRIAKLNEERDSVRNRVDTLLDLLEDINASEQTSGLLFEKKVRYQNHGSGCLRAE